jgi:hypothetical protein
MTPTPVPQPSYSAADLDRTLILALEVSEKSWVVAAHVPALRRSKPRRTLAPTTEALLEAVKSYRVRTVRAGRSVGRVVLGSAVVGWFRDRLGGAARRLRKIMVVALARKLLIALWRFATQDVIPEGAALKPAA